MSTKHTLLLSLLVSLPLVGCGAVQSQTSGQAQTGPTGHPGHIFLGGDNAATSYVSTDVVPPLGSAYVAIASSRNQVPVGEPLSAASRSVLAQGGPAGETKRISGVSALTGKNFGVIGDSLSAFAQWSPVVVQRTGMKYVFQLAVPGNTYGTVLSCYGTVAPGSPTGVYDPTVPPAPGTGGCNNFAGGNIGNVVGRTLAQNIAAVDVMVIDLGTNDIRGTLGTLGSPGDSITSGTFYGNMRWVVETVRKANPTMHLILVTPQYNVYGDLPTDRGFANAVLAYGAANGLPVVDMLALGGVTPLTIKGLTVDGVHPTPYAFTNKYGPAIAQGILNAF